MLAAVCIAPFGFKPQNAYAACYHNWRDEKIMSQPTCTVNGSTMQYCSKCRARRTVSISKLGHRTNGSYTITKYATCGTTGTRVLKCTRCYAILNSQTIPATGNHNWRDSKVFQRPTCTTNGSIQQACSGCGQTRMTSPSKLGHQTNGSYSIKPPSCTEKGRRILRCTRSGCNAVLDAQYYGEPTGHCCVVKSDGKKIYRECQNPGCNYRYDEQDLTMENTPVNGEYIVYSRKDVQLSGNIDPKNHKAYQYLKLYNDADIKSRWFLLKGNQRDADFKNDGIRLEFTSDNRATAYLNYSRYPTEKEMLELGYDDEMITEWQEYAYVSYSDKELHFYPKYAFPEGVPEKVTVKNATTILFHSFALKLDY